MSREAFIGTNTEDLQQLNTDSDAYGAAVAATDAAWEAKLEADQAYANAKEAEQTAKQTLETSQQTYGASYESIPGPPDENAEGATRRR